MRFSGLGGAETTLALLVHLGTRGNAVDGNKEQLTGLGCVDQVLQVREYGHHHRLGRGVTAYGTCAELAYVLGAGDGLVVAVRACVNNACDGLASEIFQDSDEACYFFNALIKIVCYI